MLAHLKNGLLGLSPKSVGLAKILHCCRQCWQRQVSPLFRLRFFSSAKKYFHFPNILLLFLLLCKKYMFLLQIFSKFFPFCFSCPPQNIFYFSKYFAPFPSPLQNIYFPSPNIIIIFLLSLLFYTAAGNAGSDKYRLCSVSVFSPQQKHISIFQIFSFSSAKRNYPSPNIANDCLPQNEGGTTTYRVYYIFLLTNSVKIQLEADQT